MATLEQRLWAKAVAGPNGCIIWTGSQSGSGGGYGLAALPVEQERQ